MNEGLAGKVAIVTGASRGIGAAIARDLAEAGVKVALAARTLPDLVEVATSARQVGSEALAVTADMAKLSDLHKIVEETVSRFGGVDILVNNAGVFPPKRELYDVPTDEWDYTLSVNLKAPWYLSRLVYPIMKQRGGGSVVNISSNAGLHHFIGSGVYGVSKAALIMLTITCAKEWARDKIRVNCVAPGLVRTVMIEGILSDLEAEGQKPNPLNMIGEAEDVAKLVRYLVSEDARYMSGEVVRMDGGEIL